MQDEASVAAFVLEGFRKLGLPLESGPFKMVPEVPATPEQPPEKTFSEPRIKIVIGDSSR